VDNSIANLAEKSMFIDLCTDRELEVDFSIPNVAVIYGEAGSGKTTILEHLMGVALENGARLFYHDTKGSIGRIKSNSEQELSSNGLKQLHNLMQRYPENLELLDHESDIPTAAMDTILVIDEPCWDMIESLKQYLADVGQLIVVVDSMCILESIIPNKHSNKVESIVRQSQFMRKNCELHE